MLLDDRESIDLENYSEDLNKIIKSGKALTKEIGNIVSFNPEEIFQKKGAGIDDIRGVLNSIQPLDKDEKTKSGKGLYPCC